MIHHNIGHPNQRTSIHITVFAALRWYGSTTLRWYDGTVKSGPFQERLIIKGHMPMPYVFMYTTLRYTPMGDSWVIPSVTSLMECSVHM